MTYTLACHQREIKMIWIQFWGALQSIFIYIPWPEYKPRKYKANTASKLKKQKDG